MVILKTLTQPNLDLWQPDDDTVNLTPSNKSVFTQSLTMVMGGDRDREAASCAPAGTSDRCRWGCWLSSRLYKRLRGLCGHQKGHCCVSQWQTSRNKNRWRTAHKREKGSFQKVRASEAEMAQKQINHLLKEAKRWPEKTWWKKLIFTTN